ncbi:MAG: response regulator [Candidatus Sulfotelmatobacter sp.]
MARKILLADDSVTAQNMGRKILADAGYEVITVNNGSAALKKIAEQKPDLIVLDVYMPGYSGLEVCQRLKETQETSRLPVLLTVGKLEPFKPEEAKRARADGFIVKPFEASELLSALSKLEDKIVPRPEASKPGRFARATAALEEGHYDKTVAVEEDSGWKNRIAFPSKKKEKAVQEDGDDPAIYNAINKDLRTVVERKLPHEEHEVKAEEARVDLGALAPEGLPKDVTPEEIAALAAAAAQVKGKLSEVSQAEPASAEATTEPKPEATEPIQPAPEPPQEMTAAAPPVATFAEQKSVEKNEAQAHESIETPKEAASSAAPSPADVMAAIAGLEQDAGTAAGTSSGNGSWAHAATRQTTDEPVTMAAAAGVGSSGMVSRWTAVSVALGPEDAAISLEHEMQKAYAAFAAAEVGHAASTPAIPEIRPAAAESAAAAETSSPIVAAVPETVVQVPSTPAPEAVQTLSAVASAATEAVNAAVKELETVAASYVQEKTSTPVQQAVAQATTPPEVPQTVEAPVEQTAVAAVAEADIPKPETAETDAPEPRHEEPKRHEEKNEASVQALSLATAASEVPVGQVPVSLVSPDITSVAAEPPVAKGSGDSAKKESEMAANTAAAWASWRRIRESGDPIAAKDADEGGSAPVDAAAMAVAAGAEKAPEQASSEDDPAAIASIVDSVLADLRPKIFEEVSRKMGKKK